MDTHFMIFAFILYLYDNFYYLYLYLFIYLFVYLFIYLFNYLFIYLFIKRIQFIASCTSNANCID